MSAHYHDKPTGRQPAILIWAKKYSNSLAYTIHDFFAQGKDYVFQTKEHFDIPMDPPEMTMEDILLESLLGGDDEKKGKN